MTYKIYDAVLTFGEMNKRTSAITELIIHHAAAKTCSIADVHSWHKDGNGWAGIGYNYFVRKSGTIWEGRPVQYQGAHTIGHNDQGIGICFEGNYDTEKTMPAAQRAAGKWLVSYIIKNNPGIKNILKHSDCDSTACPGRYFPFADIKAGAKETSVKKDRPDLVKKYQAWLNEEFLAGLNITGTNSAAVEKASLKAYQTLAGIEVDGVWGPECSTAADNHFKERGDHDPYVGLIQGLLFSKGYNTTGFDKGWGKGTEAAFVEFQADVGLDPDGICGPASWAKLFS